MEAIGIIIILCIIGLIGLSVYMFVDMRRTKAEVSKQFEATSSQLNAEKQTRESNIKFVVDEVNRTNTVAFDKIDSKFNPYFMISSNIPLGSNVSTSNLQLTNLPGSVSPDLTLMSHVTSLMGFTAKDLGTSNMVEFCSKSHPTRCVRFPDNSGNTFITTMSPDARVVIDPILQLGSGGLLSGNVSGTSRFLNITADTTNLSGSMSIKPSNTTMDIMNLYQNDGTQVMNINPAGYVGIGTIPVNATLSIKNRNASQLPMSIFNDSNNRIASISNDGTIEAQQVKVGNSESVKCFASGKLDTGSIAGNASKDIIVSFTNALAETPTIMLTVEDMSNARVLTTQVKSQSISATSFTITVRNTTTSTASSAVIHWFAVCTA